LGNLGFPRNIDQLQLFESVVGPLELVILIECSERTLLDRLLARGRFDDQEESIRGRLGTFNSDTSRVIELFRERKKLKVVNGEQDVDSVREEIRAILVDVVKRQ
jgi:adenylate kinase family enzyme